MLKKIFIAFLMGMAAWTAHAQESAGRTVEQIIADIY